MNGVRYTVLGTGLSAKGEPHAGIVYARQHTAVRILIQGLLIQRILDAEEMMNHIEFL